MLLFVLFIVKLTFFPVWNFSLSLSLFVPFFTSIFLTLSFSPDLFSHRINGPHTSLDLSPMAPYVFVMTLFSLTLAFVLAPYLFSEGFSSPLCIPKFSFSVYIHFLHVTLGGFPRVFWATVILRHVRYVLLSNFYSLFCPPPQRFRYFFIYLFGRIHIPGGVTYLDGDYVHMQQLENGRVSETWRTFPAEFYIHFVIGFINSILVR